MAAITRANTTTKLISIQQCFNCQAYGHIARDCKRPTSCAYCAQNHSSQDCPTARDRARAQCAVCQKQNTKQSEKTSEDHFAFDRSCPARVERVEIARHNRANGRGWYESAPISLGSEAPPGEKQGQNPIPAEATEHHTQRRGPGRPRKGNKRPRTEDEPELNSVMTDAQPETEMDTQTQTPQPREEPQQQPTTRALSAPSNGTHQEYSGRPETEAEAIPTTMVKSLINKASITPMKTQWRKNCEQNGQETTGSIAQSRLNACRSRDGNETVSNKPMNFRGHGNSSTKPAARDIQHAE
ncbi:hypothetical protein SI65_00933 [Aspergillus cristatus]|uniref:CCHC-type domain-containing protein n=1 Tax=Aspergillus cristatus TaxID=573508 RepID=A0A1E3BQT7_ASPCR|nr:hypothetical protein SI65_00933 [Aspergillus cristatus]